MQEFTLIHAAPSSHRCQLNSHQALLCSALQMICHRQAIKGLLYNLANQLVYPFKTTENKEKRKKE